MRDGGREHAGGSNEEGGRHFLAPHYFAGASGRLAGRLERLLGGLSRLFCNGRGLSRRGRARGDGRLGRGGRRPRRLELPHLLARKPAVGLSLALAQLTRCRASESPRKPAKVVCAAADPLGLARRSSRVTPPRAAAAATTATTATAATAGASTAGASAAKAASASACRCGRRRRGRRRRGRLDLVHLFARHCRRCRRRSSWRRRRARLAQAASLSGCSEEGQGALPWSEPDGPCST